MAYTTIKKPSDYFNTKLYTGNGGTNNITGVGFQPDWTWTKDRNGGAGNHLLFDAVRGANKFINSNTNASETTDTDRFMSFDSDGFTLGADGNINSSGVNFASWNWLASNTTASNTDGSITSTVSANTTSGFSIVSYTGTGANATVGHGLGVTPNIIISKRRSAIGDWLVGGSTVNTVGGGSNKLLLLNSTVAIDTNSEVYQTIGASTFQIGINAYINTNTSTMISYCFAEKKGFSKFGSYTGNGNADGTFIYTGFKPAFVILKRTDSTSSWDLYDNKRLGYNVKNYGLFPDLANTESTTDKIDILSNGFKMRTTTGGNYSGATYIYMAFAEEPLVGDNPCTAR